VEFPHFQKLYSDLKDRGLEMLAVNSVSQGGKSPKSREGVGYESNELINHFVAYNKITMPIGLSDREDKESMAGKYGFVISVVDQHGIVVHKSSQSVVYIQELREVLARMGIK
jgi:hypothetical protein